MASSSFSWPWGRPVLDANVHAMLNSLTQRTAVPHASRRIVHTYTRRPASLSARGLWFSTCTPAHTEARSIPLLRRTMSSTPSLPASLKRPCTSPTSHASKLGSHDLLRHESSRRKTELGTQGEIPVSPAAAQSRRCSAPRCKTNSMSFVVRSNIKHSQALFSTFMGRLPRIFKSLVKQGRPS